MLFKKMISAAAIALPLTAALSASAADTVNHATLCNPQPTDVSKFVYNKFGILNTSSSTGGVACGATVPILATINKVEVEAFDRHTTANVSCTLTLTDLFATTLWTGSTSTTGNGFATKMMLFSPGVGTHTLSLDCSVPGQQVGGDVSGIATYRVITP